MADTLSYILIGLGAYSLWWMVQRLRGSHPFENIAGPPSRSILTGNLAAYLDPDGWEFHKRTTGRLSPILILASIQTPQLFVFDPVALHHILIRNSDAYENPRTNISLFGTLWGPGLFSSGGEDHSRFRRIAAPAFATSKIREMIPLFYEVAERARDGLIAPALVDGPTKLDLNHILARVSLEIIGRAGIGYSFDPMIYGQEPEDKYAETLKDVLPVTFNMGILFPILPYLLKIGPPAFRRFVVDAIPSKTLHHARDLVDHMHRMGSELIRNKKEALTRGQLEITEDSKDIMSLLLKGNLTADEGMFLTDDELVGQTGMIISAATDTTSSGLSRMLELLCLYPEMQEKLRKEILEAPERMDYEQLGLLPFLDAFLHEVLRLYPPATPAMIRETVKDATLPLSTPLVGVDGRELTSIPVPKGSTLYIAIAAANHNRHIWGDDVLEFKPERWQDGKAGLRTAKVNGGVYGNMMTFIGGPRSCIGFQFALLEMKVVLAVLLRTFKFSAATGEVKWKMSGIIAIPTVDGEVQMPLTVEKIDH
ncbi:cytochrome P450 [Mycena vitilis]|nr:cytochrome P450 [Mycena vitilis]